MDIPETSSIPELAQPHIGQFRVDLIQWVKISEPMESGESVPIVSFNYNDYQGNPSEAYISGQQADGNLWIQLVQSGNPSTFYRDEYSITLDGDTLTNGAATEVTAPSIIFTCPSDCHLTIKGAFNCASSTKMTPN